MDLERGSTAGLGARAVFFFFFLKLARAVLVQERDGEVRLLALRDERRLARV